MRSGTIRLRITLLAVVIASVVLALAAVVVVFVVQAQLRDSLDRSLEQRADQIEQSALSDPSAALLNSNQEDRFAQVLDVDGAVILATENVAGAPALAALPEGRQAAVTRSDLPLEDDIYRVLIRRFDLQGGTQFVVVAENIDDLRDGVRALIITLAVVFPAAVLALAATVWWLVGRTLRPVEQIRREVAGIGLDELERRVPAPGTGDEVDRLAGTMNDMLARLERSSAHQRRFVADVSHELRTPLTRMRTTLEVDLAAPGRDLEATCRSVLGDSIDMQTLVDDLLFLARHDAGAIRVRHEALDLDVIIDEQVRRQRAVVPQIEIDMSGVGAALVFGDHGQLTRLVANLLSNATRHAAARVQVSLSDFDDGVRLEVGDDGPGIPEVDRQRVFERFVRLDASRSGALGGSGLGLAIARDIADLHRATITVGEHPLGGAGVEVVFPPPSADRT